MNPAVVAHPRSETMTPGSKHRAPRGVRRRPTRGERLETRTPRKLARWVDDGGIEREIVARELASGTLLVIDRPRAGRAEARLVANIGSNEPAANANLVCAEYLTAVRDDRGGCRLVTDADLEGGADCLDSTTPCDWRAPVGADDRHFRLAFVDTSMSIPEIRWCVADKSLTASPTHPVSVRAVVAALTDYEPVRAITLAALAELRPDVSVSTTVLDAELTRVLESPIVLNRRLREVTLEAVARGVSMSEIAMRCGRVKRDAKGKRSGETSWLGRRIGLLPEGGHDDPTPWVHSDVLALIARTGLGVSPREVEVK